jgi:hypothetical protein
MGRASSSKKVARAAGTGGGRTSGGRIPWTYYGAIALVVVLGVVGTWSSRDRRESQINGAGTSAPAIGTTWNEAIAFYQCGTFAPNVKKAKSDPYGLTTNGNGIMHISPTTKSAAGKNATLGKWASANGVKLTAAQLQLPGGKLYTAGDSCEGGKGQVYVKQFAYAGDPAGVLVKGDPTNVHLQDQLELVVAFVPSSKSSKIPAPPAAIVSALKALAASTGTTTTTTPGPAAATTTPTTAAGSPTTAAGTTPTTAGSTTATTAAGSPATTTASGTTSPTTAAGSTATTAGGTTATTVTGSTSATTTSPTTAAQTSTTTKK